MRGRNWRDHVPTLVVAAVSAAFGVALLQVTDALATVIATDGVTGGSGFVARALPIVAGLFIVVAVYVGAIVTANTVATIIAGRTRLIALYRLIGSSARDERRAVAREGLGVGVLGSLLGAGLGMALGTVVLALAREIGVLGSLDGGPIPLTVVIPVVAVALTTWLASWIGARRVLDVTPLQAFGASAEQAAPATASPVLSIVLAASGTTLLAAGVVVGLTDSVGVLIAAVGGVLSFSAVVFAARILMPPVLRLVGRAFGTSAPVRLAAANAIRYPERSARASIGLVIGVTLITMFVVAVASFQRIIAIARLQTPDVYLGIDEILDATVVVFSVLVGVSALIAAIGLVNTLSLSVLQRRRELGLLRALGFTIPQVRRMIVIESAQVVLTSVFVGLALGILYGWAGAQAMLGSSAGVPGLVIPAVPLPLLGMVIAGAAVLTIAASVLPARRATRMAPVAALALD